MSYNDTKAGEWKDLQDAESHQVEDALRRAGFRHVDAYRYNPASLRLRIIDESFRGMTREERDDRVEPFLSTLSENIQADIMNLVLLYPGEEQDSFRAFVNNEEFEHPLKSML